MNKRENDWGNQSSKDHRENLDSPINTKGTQDDSSLESKTADEDAAADPNENRDKASFSDGDKRANDRGRFDGEIKI